MTCFALRLRALGVFAFNTLAIFLSSIFLSIFLLTNFPASALGSRFSRVMSLRFKNLPSLLIHRRPRGLLIHRLRQIIAQPEGHVGRVELRRRRGDFPAQTPRCPPAAGNRPERDGTCACSNTACSAAHQVCGPRARQSARTFPDRN